ncbi:MAG: type VI secretion system tip protein VgrG, partial [Rhodoferax sp.]
VLEGGNITFTCPGTFLVKGGSHPFGGGGGVAAALPVLPDQLVTPATEDLQLEHSYHDAEGLKGAKYSAKLSNGETRTGTLDGAGKATIAGVPAATMAEITYGPAEFAFKPKGAQPNPSHSTATGNATSSALVDKYAADMQQNNKT